MFCESHCSGGRVADGTVHSQRKTDNHSFCFQVFHQKFEPRKIAAAADVVQQLQDAARRAEIAPWSVQLRGVALPASGEYTADRLDVVLPPLAQAPAPNSLRLNPYVLRPQATTVRPDTTPRVN